MKHWSHYGKKFPPDQKITMARMRAQGFGAAAIAEAIGESRVRVKTWINNNPNRIAEAQYDLDREAAEAARADKQPRDSFIPPVPLARLMAGRA
jgi:DNA invertase Pin-like site-specific DNA recombinase